MPAKKKSASAKSSGAVKRASSPARKSAGSATTRTRGASRKGGAAASRGPAAASSSSLPETAPTAGSPGLELALAIADAADSKKAENVVILDLRGLSTVTDFYVIASGTSAPHLRAIRNEVEDRMREDRQEKPHSAQGLEESQWLVLDYGDVVLHLFHGEKRDLYALEDLWSDAPRVEWAARP